MIATISSYQNHARFDLNTLYKHEQRNDDSRLSSKNIIYGQHDTMLLCDWMYNDASILFKMKPSLVYARVKVITIDDCMRARNELGGLDDITATGVLEDWFVESPSGYLAVNLTKSHYELATEGSWSTVDGRLIFPLETLEILDGRG